MAVLAMSSCSMHDPYEDIMEVGQPVPTVTWALGSTVAAAGDSVEFEGKYYTEKGRTPERSEVWSNVVVKETAAATLGLTSSLKYTQTVTLTDTVRTSQVVATYPHSMAGWDGHEYKLVAKFPTSQTLKSVTWSSVSEWDQERFESYYPESFATEFVDKVKTYLTKDSTYYNDLRGVYINYEFTAEQIQGVIANYPQLQGLDQLVSTDAGEKSDIWYTKVTRTEGSGRDEVEVENVVGYYYISVTGGVTAYKEVALDDPNLDTENGTYKLGDTTVPAYKVYESSPWVFCRYDDNAGTTVTAVRANYLPVFKDLISLIPFTDWIYNSSDNVYSVAFTRSYSLGVVFKVIDTDGNVGYTTEVKEVTLN